MSAKEQLRYINLSCIIVCTVLSLNGCHMLKKSTTTGKALSKDESVVRKVINSQPDWKFVDIRMTGKAEEDKNKIGFMGSIKMEKDKQLFLVLRSTIGIELARVYADRDSVWLVAKMLGIKEKFDWKIAGGKLGYPLDFISIQGILMQSLFTSSGDQINSIIEHLVVKNDKDASHLVSKTDLITAENAIKYYCDFLINKENFIIEDVKIRDINGQWITDVNYLYNKENSIKKILLKGIDSQRNFAVEINIVKREIKIINEINFERF